MSELGRFFTEQCEAQGISNRQLAQRMDVDPTVIAKARKDGRVTFDPGTVEKMLAGISHEPAVKDAMMVAWLKSLRDKFMGGRARLIEIRLHGTAEKPVSAKDELLTALRDCDDDFRADIETLIRARKSSSTRKAVSAMARLIEAADQS